MTEDRNLPNKTRGIEIKMNVFIPSIIVLYASSKRIPKSKSSFPDTTLPFTLVRTLVIPANKEEVLGRTC